MTNLRKYLKIYRILAVHNFSTLIVSRLDFALLLTGKVIKMVVGIITVEAIFANTQYLAGYTHEQVFLFFAVFNLMSVLIQAIFFRGFGFTEKWVKSGEFDRFLTYPISEVFLNAFKITDWIDITSLVPALGIFAYAYNLSGPIEFNLVPFSLVFISGLGIAFAIEMAIAATNFYSPQAAPLHFIFRELGRATRFPLTIYPQGLQRFLTFVIPIAFLSFIPTKALLGELETGWILTTPGFAVGLVYLSRKFWKRGLRRYSSVSS